MDAISSTAKVGEVSDKVSMAASSPISAALAKPNTTKTSKLTPEQMLEVLADVLAKCQQIGIEIRSLNHENSAIVIIDGTKIEEGKFVPLNI